MHIRRDYSMVLLRAIVASVFLVGAASPACVGVSSAQSANDRLIEEAAAMFGFVDLTDEHWERLERARAQVLEGVSDASHEINLSQAVAIAYIGLVLRNEPSRYKDGGLECEVVAKNVYAFIDTGNNDRAFGISLHLRNRDATRDMLGAIRSQAIRCGCYEVADIASEVRVDNTLTQERFQNHGEAMAEALKGCR